MKRKGRRGWRIKRFKVGTAKQHEVFEGEAVGLVMAMDMVREEKKVREVSIYTDNQAAITAMGKEVPESATHIIDMIHRQHRRLKRTHARAQVTIRWVPGHSDVLGNEKADEQAKRAAKGDTTAPEDLPACLRKSFPISKAAVKRQFRGKLREAAVQAWKASPRSRKLERIDPTFTLARFRKTIDDMPKDQSAVLVQLRTGHIALNHHLHRIGKADAPTCPCCMRADETVQHFLFHCPAHAIARRGLTQDAG